MSTGRRSSRWGTPGRRQGARRRGRQLSLPGDHGRDPDDRRDPRQRDEASAGDDDVRRALRDATRSGRTAAARPRLWSGSRGAGSTRWCTGAACRSSGDRPADRGRLGLRDDQPGQHPGRQRRGIDQGHHRPGQQGPAPASGRLGITPRLGLGRFARPRLPRDRQGRRREEGRHRGRVALRQGRAGYDGVRPALRRGPDRLVRRRRRQAASPELRRGGREPSPAPASITGWRATS